MTIERDPISARHRARTLELIIRAAAAEERLLGRRLERAAADQRRLREEMARERAAQEGSSER